MKDVFEEEGEVASVDLLAALCAIGRGGRTGKLTVERSDERTVFVFEGGVLVDLNAPGETSVPEVLIRSGKIQRETYEALIIPAGEDRFAIAAASGVVSRKEASWGRKLSAIETLARLLSWSEGSYSLSPLAPQTSSGFRLPVDKWILELFLRSNDRALVMSRIGPTDLPLTKAANFSSAFASLGLTADADAVASLVDGRRTIEEIVRKARADEFAVLKLLAALITLGLVVPAYEAPFAAPAAELPIPVEPVEPNEAVEPLESNEVFEPVEANAALEPPVQEIAAPPSLEPIAVPLFALTAPEPREPEPEIDSAPMPAEPAASGRGRAGIWIALAFAAAAAALWWKFGRSAPTPPASQASPARETKIEQKAPALPPAPVPARETSRAGTERRKSIVIAPAPKAEADYTVQLELACEDATVAKARRADPSGKRIWIAPYDFGGRRCYRVLWGRYKSLARAKEAKASVPSMFRQHGNQPAVIAISSVGKEMKRR